MADWLLGPKASPIGQALSFIYLVQGATASLATYLHMLLHWSLASLWPKHVGNSNLVFEQQGL